MRSWSLRLGRFFGIEVFIHWSFWLLIVWVLLMHVDGGIARGLRGVAFILALFLCVVIHEFGHALTAKRFGIKTRDITLYPIGGIASLQGMPEKPGQELLVTGVGPLINIAIAGLLFIYLTVVGGLPDMSRFETAVDVNDLPFLYSLFLANLMLALFNLLPAFPMDGGRILRAILSFWLDRMTATRIAAGLGQTLAVIFVFLGFFFNLWLVFIGLFIFIGAGGERAHATLRYELSGLTVGDAVMTDFTTLESNATIGDAARTLLDGQETEFIVVDQGTPAGLLTKNDIIRGLAESGANGAVSAFATKDFLVVEPQIKLADFFEQMVQTGNQAAMVLENGRLVGFINRENVEERFLIQQALRSNAATLKDA